MSFLPGVAVTGHRLHDLLLSTVPGQPRGTPRNPDTQGGCPCPRLSAVPGGISGDPGFPASPGSPVRSWSARPPTWPGHFLSLPARPPTPCPRDPQETTRLSIPEAAEAAGSDSCPPTA